MNNRTATLARLIGFGICAGWLVFSAAVQASEIDIDKPIAIRGDMGAAVFSITIRGDVQAATYVKWRALGGTVGGDGRSGEVSVLQGSIFGNEAFSKTARRSWGRFAGLSLPPGDYEFYGLRTVGGPGNKHMLWAKREFSRRFSVVPGKIQYVGNLDIYERPAVFTGVGFLSMAFLGMMPGTAEIYPSLRDEGDLDIPLLVSAGNGLNAVDVQRSVTDDETDRHMQDIVSKLRSGDLGARRSLLLGLVNGWGMTESGEAFKVQEDKELQRQLGEQLAQQGVSGGAYALGSQQLQVLQEQLRNKLASDVDGAQTLAYLLADAERYMPDAMNKAVWIYANGLPGVAADRSAAGLWRDRLDALATLSTGSVPYLDTSGKAEFEKFRAASMPRYFALSASGAFGLSKGEDGSAEAAIQACEARNAEPAERCRLYAENRSLAWDACPAEYAGEQATSYPPVTGLGKVDDTSHLPASLNSAARVSYRDFLAARMPRAFAVSDSGEVGMASGDCHAAYKALKACNALSGKGGQLYALDDQIVFGSENPQLLEVQRRLAASLEKTKSIKLAGQVAQPAVKN